MKKFIKKVLPIFIGFNLGSVLVNWAQGNSAEEFILDAVSYTVAAVILALFYELPSKKSVRYVLGGLFLVCLALYGIFREEIISIILLPVAFIAAVGAVSNFPKVHKIVFGE